ncbi:DNA-binding MarR family transcriptional regulator [Herbaspirillum sp. Sphag1AN]|uniref:MarR family winged helix-turn-helix transcriptional regulator n=1 Tax=unclassified Herbaspirillum TaxID=2624150 RepID=UPI00160B09FA|nr:MULTISPECIES: MarR family winged helix-turn-helix transcriptional regulator [unclassified Herbaspirillum]MBB3214533.1 DNA-binding MarR family transcriptional regulator [Herbaspirillum sp. Sphag1AN]MBB3247627.1 DNA-binding MarR family transcriptional regulator [Herbaspirillum sp. Sphag64]
MSSKPEHLGWLVKRIQHRHHRHLDKKLGELGLSLVQWNALREIDRNPGCSQLQLAELTFNSAQAFGTLVTRLLKAELVKSYPGSGRSTLHELTAKGRALLEEGQKTMFDVTNASFGLLSDEEQEHLKALLEKVLAHQPPESLP